MLSISNISANQASTYYDKDGYYARLDGAADHWQGKLKSELALPDNVNKADFDRLVAERRERAGFDLTFSAPKSVSIAMCLSPVARQDMLAAHNAAVQQALAEIEARAIGARVTQNGKTEHTKTGNMICGKFNHYVSRNQDPQLHTHAVVINKTQYQGKTYAIDNPDLYRGMLLYGQIYRNSLAAELMSRGYEVVTTDPQKGFFELKGIDPAALERFSTRRAEIVQKLKEWGTGNAKAAEKATLLTRHAKQSRDLNTLMQSWRATVEDIGGVALAKSPAPIKPPPEAHQAALQQAADRLLARNFAVPERDLRRAVLASGVGVGMSEAEYTAALSSAANSKTIIGLGSRKDGKDTEVYYTTTKNLQVEREIFAMVAAGKGTAPGIDRTTAEKSLDQALARESAPLSSQQRQAVLHIATAADQHVAVQGLAGTGKTHMLKYARQVLESQGYTVKGACFTGKAADGLQQNAKIPSSTIHSFLNKLEREAGHAAPAAGEDMQVRTAWDLQGLKPANKPEAWIVDEASMVDNNTMHHLLQAAQVKGAKVVLVGDRQQLLPVGMGNSFSVLTETGKISTVQLEEIRRQKDVNLLQAVRESVKGDLYKAIELVANDTREIARRGDRLKAIVADYTALPPEQQRGTVILTAANKDRRELNAAIRTELKKRGLLQGGAEFAAETPQGRSERREFCVHDKIIFLRNDNRLGVKNGMTGVVTKIDGHALTVDIGGKEIAVDTRQYKKIDHGYAMTTHKAQGITVDRVLIHLDSRQRLLNSRNAFYVDISRARHEVKIYADDMQKVTGQVREWAKKLTGADFPTPSIGAPAPTLRQKFDMAIEKTLAAIKNIQPQPRGIEQPKPPAAPTKGGLQL